MQGPFGFAEDHKLVTRFRWVSSDKTSGDARALLQWAIVPEQFCPGYLASSRTKDLELLYEEAGMLRGNCADGLATSVC